MSNKRVQWSEQQHSGLFRIKRNRKWSLPRNDAGPLTGSHLMWEKKKKQLTYIYFSEKPLHEKFLHFHTNLTKHYQSGGQRLYKPDIMEKFSNNYAPGLFDELLATISNNERGKISSKRIDTQKQRVVALLHQLSYFRNQVWTLNINKV